tara:strand:+ start:2633 stop:2863 length:231 start_codon:yes stop_codon:yes gene_type:complete
MPKNPPNKVKRIEEVIDFLKKTRIVMYDILRQLEEEERYEDCADLYEQVGEITKDIIEHERLKEISDYTGRQYNIY